MYDCIIIGKGPAGISAGLYVKRANLNVLIIGKDGGTLETTEKIENYYGFENPISGKQLLENGLKQAKRLQIPIDTDEVVSVEYKENEFIVETRNNEYKSKTLILATGSRRNIPTIKGIKEYEGNGVSYCAICDGFFYKGKNVAVLGNGDYALKEANILSKTASKVTILTDGKDIVENRTEMPSNIHLETRQIQSIEGTKRIEDVKFKDNSSLKTDGLFVALGTATSFDFAKKLGAIIKNNYIEIDENMRTNVPRLYACGDCTGGLLQISKAVYEGAKAGTDIISLLKKDNNVEK